MVKSSVNHLNKFWVLPDHNKLHVVLFLILLVLYCMPVLDKCRAQHSVIVTITPRRSRSLLHHTSLLFNNALYPHVMLLEFIDIIWCFIIFY